MAMLVALAAAACIALVLLPLLGTSKVAFAVVLVSVTIAPAPLLVVGARASEYIVGVSAPELTIYTYTVAITLVAAWGVATGRSSHGHLVAAPAVFFALAAVAIWPQSTLVISGTIHMLLACLAWLAGTSVASQLSLSTSSMFATMLLMLIAAVLAVPAWLQWATGAGADGFGTRTSGIFAHPSTVGKVAIVVIALLLPMTRSLERRTARIALLGTLVAASSAIPSLSRANILAIAGMLLIWFALGVDRRKIRQFLVVTVVVLIVSSPFIGGFLSRFAIDPDGGDRPELLAAGIRQLPPYILFGMGPNNYVATVGPLEPIVAFTGFPVHNGFVLWIAEVGIVGTILLLPLLIAVLRAAWMPFPLAATCVRSRPPIPGAVTAVR